MTTDLMTGIGGILITYMFGSYLVAGAVLFIVLLAYGLISRFTLDCWIATMPSLAWTLCFNKETQLLPQWLWPIFALIMGILISMGMLRVFARR